MNRLLAAAVVVLVLLAAAPAAEAGVRLIYSDGRSPRTLQRWVAQAQVPTPDIAVIVHGVECAPWPGLGTSCAAGHALWLAPDPDRRTLWHELGHLSDEWSLTGEDRRRFGELTGDRRAWEDESVMTAHGWVDSPSERFADAYSLCAMGRRWSAAKWLRRSDEAQLHDYGYRPTPQVHRSVCALVRG